MEVFYSSFNLIIVSDYSIPILTNPPSTTLSGFAPSARFTTITTSAVAIAKVAPTQVMPATAFFEKLVFSCYLGSTLWKTYD